MSVWTSVETELLAPSVTRASVEAVRDDGCAVVRHPGNGGLHVCDVLETAQGVRLTLAAGDAVLVWLAPNDSQRGVVVGRIGPSRAPAPAAARAPEPEPEIPDELVIEARESLTLKCGDGSITFRADGRILIKGEDLVSHAQRMNRIKGGAVSIN